MNVNKSIERYSHGGRAEVEHITLDRHAIGFVVRGRRLIHDGKDVRVATAGDLFYLPAGSHYVEDLPESGRPSEQMVFYYTPEQLSRALSMLSADFGMEIEGRHECGDCGDSKYVICPAWPSMRGFFASVGRYLRDGGLTPAIERIKMLELLCLIVSNPDCCLQSRILGDGDRQANDFEQTVRDNLFEDVTLDDLARLTNRSLTSFKKEFHRRFFEPPHKWVTRNRLTHARMLLVTSGTPVSEIGTACAFPNTSHFIKLFRKEFGFTPAVYRKRHIEGEAVKVNPKE